ncbi:AP endonuclease, family 2 [Streptococcus porcinus]|uniref:sugar phosphate isomerase/epimerase family protein n=1 Tax=Streptococcus porcinus TaxID=1340 RepID=UPI0010CABB09|nr:AP endonuclease [Streptococcus porcinus]VTS46142.1 AP endonuclease, family 2 [Streptococcus porcinus]
MFEKENLIINSIAFKAQLEAGLLQENLLDQVFEMGFKRFEVRREFLKSIPQELEALKEKAKELDLALFYSINENLLVNNKINPNLNDLIQEARMLGAPFLKLNIGDATNLTLATLQALKELLSSDMRILVENNQDTRGGSLSNCSHFMSLVHQAGLPIGFVFDTANWAFLGESLSQATLKMCDFTTYLHCKNYQKSLFGLENSPSLFEGEIDITTIILQFPKARYLALEYTTTNDQLLADAQKLSQLKRESF